MHFGKVDAQPSELADAFCQADVLLLGWTSEDMPRHYGASAAAERAQEIQVQLGIGEGV
ncbi:hypothetical protein AB0F49_30205 [Micromonospora ureilytica]|uniref:hypothetical protein n=1 Tax=Micromonospora ureilytica TaxID=709868 RepID=UPI0033CFB55F